jgi:uncharacterized protein YbjT (DUF2867 family)
MQNILILGASGSIARVATEQFLEHPDVRLTLYVRNPRRLKSAELKNADPDRVRVVEGDVLDAAILKEAMRGQDMVYANLAGELERMARAVVLGMKEVGPRRLIWISSMGIYDEVPGQKYDRVLDPYRASAQVIEESDLDYTILRPAWFTNADEVDYETTRKGEPFRGGVVSRRSVADLVVKLALLPDLELRGSLGVNKPE